MERNISREGGARNPKEKQSHPPSFITWGWEGGWQWRPEEDEEHRRLKRQGERKVRGDILHKGNGIPSFKELRDFGHRRRFFRFVVRGGMR